MILLHRVYLSNKFSLDPSPPLCVEMEFYADISWESQGRHGEFDPGKAQYSTPIFLTSCFL